MEDLAGKQFGSYRVVAPLGEGGMAAVYKAYQPSVDRHVALKILSRYYTTDPEFLTRFTHEAKIVAQLQHPHILSVFDFGESDGYTYLVMPFVNGGTLAGLLKGKPVSMNATLKIAGQICAALDYAHSKGIVHRDIKPSNILIDEGGNCLVADFGLARMAEGSQKLTMTGTVMGTPAYMSPEQAAGKEIGPQSDIYSAGIVLYEMLTGRVPFQAETPIAVAIKHLTDPLPPPRSLNPALSEQTEAVLLKALARAKEDRFASGEALMIALAGALQSIQQADTLVAPPPAMPAPGPSALPGFPAAASTLAMRGAPVTAPPQEITGTTFRHVEPGAGPAASGGRGSSWMAIVAAAVVVIGVVAYFVVGRSADQPAATPQAAAAVAAPSAGVAVATPAPVPATATATPGIPPATSIPAAPKLADRPANPEPVAPTPPAAAATPAAAPVASTTGPAKDDTFEKGRVAFNARRYAEAMPLLQSAADGGNVGAMFMLGLSYDQGRGVSPDLVQARQWYEKAATAGNGEAMNRLGSMYMTGRGGLPRNLNLARQWFEKSAAAETPAGMMQLGDLYANGRGVPKDIGQARQWYEKADALHFQGAQQRLASLPQ